MKKLSEDCKGILTIAEKTTNSPAKPQFSLINGDGKTSILPWTQRQPETNDKEITACLRRILNSCLTITRKTVITDYGTEFVDDVKVDGIRVEQQNQALALLNDYKRPLADDEVIKLIGRLQTICPEKSIESVDRKARTLIWLEELRAYPADIVTAALKRRYRWFPTIAEILDWCDNALAYRRLLEQKIRFAEWDKEYFQ